MKTISFMIKKDIVRQESRESLGKKEQVYQNGVKRGMIYAKG